MGIDPQRSLQNRFPEIAAEWHPTKNAPLTAKEVTYGSNKIVWWQCQKVKNHIYQSSITSRTRKRSQGCSYCAGKKVSSERSLATLFPEIAKEWHPTKNESLTPNDVTFASSKKVWWQCLNQIDHIYEAKISHRTRKENPTVCKVCALNKRSLKKSPPEKSLATLFPEIAKEWHPTKNESLTPNDVTSASHRKVWWQCKRFKDHVWDATVANRTRGETGCRFCSNQSSKPEIRILSELKLIFKNIISRKRFLNQEIDIYLPDIKLGIEYDGYFFHKDKGKKDLSKNRFFEKKGIYIIRVREKPLLKINDTDILINEDILSKNNVDNLLALILEKRNIKPSQILMKIDEYAQNNDFLNEELFKVYLSSFPSPLPENSLEFLFPEIAKEWHVEKNSPLLPINFSPGSNQDVWWQCSKVKSHIYLSMIKSRTGKGTGCSFCSSTKLSPEKSLATLSPQIAAEWHLTKNAPLTPADVMNQSHKKVWWQCPKLEVHQYEAHISSRTSRGDGCPFCRGLKVSFENSLAHLSPDVAAEWHPTKNAPLTPKDVTNKSGKKVWWQCLKNTNHVWDAVISSRTDDRRVGCRFCARRGRK